MDVTAPLQHSLQDEHVIGMDPPMKPDLPGVWRRRINPFVGRAISDKALTAEQDMRAGLQRLHGLSMTAGIVNGLQLSAEMGALGQAPADAWVRVSSGLGLCRSGEDVDLGAALHLSLGMLPLVVSVAANNAIEAGLPLPPIAPAPDPSAGARDGEGLATRLLPEAPRTISRLLTEVIDEPAAAALPRVGIIVAQPVGATILGSGGDDCPSDPRDDPYIDLQRVDGGRLLLYLWPSEMVARAAGPDYSLPAAGAARRNQLAYRVFDVERGFLADEMHPWEAWGVPLALVGFDEDWKLDFIDRATVVRRGGQPLPRTPVVPQSGNASLWQSRVDQLVEHISDLPDLTDATLRAGLRRVPPVGVLPGDIYDPVMRRQHFFPGGFAIDAIPVPRSDLDLALREAASLVPFNLSVADRVELLIPVPDPAYEPGLLETATVDPRFETEIAAAEADRSRWINRREQIRRRHERLVEATTGTPGTWPTDSMVEGEILPPMAVAPPLIVTRTRRFAQSTGPVSHALETDPTLAVAAGDVLWFWVRVQSDAGLTGLSLRLATSERSLVGLTYGHGVYWGSPDGMAISTITTTGLAERRVADLPPTGFWHRLEVPADHRWTVPGTSAAGKTFSGIEFTSKGGDIEFGPFGKDDSTGQSIVWIANEAPAAAVFNVNGAVGPWAWTEVPDRALDDLASYGTSRIGDARTVDVLETLKAEWPQTFLQADIAKLTETGLGIYLDEIEMQLKSTNDAIDLGFVRARSDIYRVRQFMLGGDTASRLVTSPSLADLAVRDEGARATSAGISKFITDAISRTPTGITVRTPTPTAPPEPPPQPTTNGGSFAGFNNGTTFNNVFAVARSRPFSAMAAFGTGTAISTPTAVRTPAASAVLASSVVSSFAERSFAVSEASFIAPSSPVVALDLARSQFAIPINVARASLSTGLYAPRDVRAQRPIAGLIERTISVAERLTPSPAVQALEYAIASKAAVLQTVRGLNVIVDGRTRGVATDDLVVPGFATRTVATPPPTVALLFADQALAADSRVYIDQDVMPDKANKHESDYFTAAVNAIDNAIALMRLVEGRVSLFEGLADRVRETRDAILGQARAAAAELRSIDVELAEARHDLATAAALLAEETARVEALNSRRQATLTGVTLIAYRRVRECDNRDVAPTQELLSGLAETPVAACRREHPNTPPEIERYVSLLRDAPVKWFPRIAQAVAKIDRTEAAIAALQFSRQIAMAMPVMAEFVPAQHIRGAPKFLASALQATEAQYRTLAVRRQSVAQLELSQLSRFSLTQYHAQIRETSTLGDLVQGAHRNAQLTRMTSDLLHGLSEISACLHAEFAEVAPIVRLTWAEALSEFDRPAELSQLGGLPTWGEVSREARHTLQGLTDWLFSQIDRDNEKARAMMNDLVRIALLLAAHSPVNRLIPARLAAESPARIGTRLPLLLDAGQARIGMVALIRDRTNSVVSRAVIEDIADGRASARIIHSITGVTTIVPTMRIELAAQALGFGK